MRNILLLFSLVMLCFTMLTGCTGLSRVMTKVPVAEIALKVAVFEVAKANPAMVKPMTFVVNAALERTSEDETLTLGQLEPFIFAKIKDENLDPVEAILAQEFVKELLVSAETYIRTDDRWYTYDSSPAAHILGVVREALALVNLVAPDI